MADAEPTADAGAGAGAGAETRVAGGLPCASPRAFFDAAVRALSWFGGWGGAGLCWVPEPEPGLLGWV